MSVFDDKPVGVKGSKGDPVKSYDLLKKTIKSS